MDISSETKVNDLLQAFPQLEDVLIALNPKFKSLKNPLLRNSVGRVATLKQAASVVNIPLLTFINHLRNAAGQTPLDAI